MESKIIHAHVYDPTTGFFADKKGRAKSRWVSCSLSDSCPLHAVGQCARLGMLHTHNCPYGVSHYKEGLTRRARKFYSWMGDERSRLKGIPALKSAKKKITFIGDYVYLPYGRMSWNKSVPFIRHGSPMGGDYPFLSREHWNAGTVSKLVNFYPQALFGGELSEYQKEEVPLFLNHLSEVDPDTFKEFEQNYPEVLKRYSLRLKDYVGREALLKTLKPPFSFETKGSSDGGYKVTWNWDGETLTTNSANAYDRTWGAIKVFDQVEVSITPNDKTAIKILDNSWVTDKTVLLD